MTRGARLLAAATILALLVGADGPKSCQRQGDVKTNRPDRERPRPILKREVELGANGDHRYHVIVTSARKGQSRLMDQSDTWLDNGGPYRQTLDYETGLKIDIVVTVENDPEVDPKTNPLSCYIKDKGSGKSVASTGLGLLQCNITTSG